MFPKCLAALVAASALATSGCCSIARLACDWPLPTAPACGNRETPDAALDFLVAAFHDRNKHELYESFHPDFVAENGRFSETEFGVAYEKAEEDFVADAENLAAAKRRWLEPHGDTVVVELTNDAAGAFFPIQLENRPKIRIVTKDPFVGTIRGTVRMHDLVRLENGRLTLPQSFDLTSIEGVQTETVAGLSGADIVRVEFSDDWVVRRIDTGRARGIRFLVKLKEYTAK